METLRIGILGAARIAPVALIKPAKAEPRVEVTAVAARDRAKAESFASKHSIPRVLSTYEDLISDPEIDAIYNPLPNGLHATWTIKALEARKHVLCEKPFAANAEEARKVAAVAASKSDRVVMEAFHYRYHPLVERMVAILRSGEIGDIRHIETRLCVPYMKKGDIRYRLDLAGGATMDVGCYAIHLLRTLAGSEPKVVSARAKLSSPKVDRWMQAEFNLPGGATGKMTCALFSASLISTGAKVIGSKGEMSAINTTAPHIFHRLTIKTPNAKRTEKLDRHSTYSYQLRAFADAVLDGKPVLTPPSDSIANMEVIDAVYEQSGLGKRPTWTGSST